MKPRWSSPGVLAFCARFFLLAPVCLVLWWLALPYYLAVLGQTAGQILIHVLRIPIEAMNVRTAGLLNTETVLAYTVAGKESPIEVVALITNVATYAALAGATAGLSLRRFSRILAIGLAVLVVSHVIYIVFAFRFASTVAAAPEFPTALAQFLIMLPLLLWIVLVYWDRVTGHDCVAGKDAGAPSCTAGKDVGTPSKVWK